MLRRCRIFALLAFVSIAIATLAAAGTAKAQENQVVLVIVGQVQDGHEEPVEGAEVQVLLDGRPLELREGFETRNSVLSQSNGAFTTEAQLPEGLVQRLMRGESSLSVEVRKSAFRTVTVPAQVAWTTELGTVLVHVPPITLRYRYDAGFWVATLAFALVLAMIATGRLHKTVAALLGVVIVMLASGIGTAVWPSLHIFSIQRAFQYVDMNVIFLILGMMSYVGIAERTGLFQRLAYLSYRASRGKIWLLALLLMGITAVASAFLDNVTTMLLVSPISIEIALVLGVNPLSLLIPEVLASNVGGTATLIGDPPNILIGSFIGKSFLDFLVTLGPVVLLAMLVAGAFVMLWYRHDHRSAAGIDSKALMARLQADSAIRNPVLLRRVLIVGAVMLVLFVTGEWLHVAPSVVALAGAVALMIWSRPDVEELLHDVDWTTLIFFAALFIIVGAVEEVGLLQAVADLASRLAGGSLTAGMLLVMWISAVASGIIDNIPFTAAMLPVAAYLTRVLPGAENDVLFWALSVGACFGGNFTLVAASANLVTAGIAERAGYTISYRDFAKVGVPFTLLTLLVATAYFLIVF